MTQWSLSGLTMPLSRCSVGIYLEMSSHNTCQGTFSHSHLSSLSNCGLILPKFSKVRKKTHHHHHLDYLLVLSKKACLYVGADWLSSSVSQGEVVTGQLPTGKLSRLHSLRLSLHRNVGQHTLVAGDVQHPVDDMNHGLTSRNVGTDHHSPINVVLCRPSYSAGWVLEANPKQNYRQIQQQNWWWLVR